MSDRDVDAQFADIVAHWDDVAPDPQAQRAPAPEGETGTGPDRGSEVGTDPGSEVGTDRDGTAPESRSSVNPSPLNPSPVEPVTPPPMLGGIPVWRGATPAAPSDGDKTAPAAPDDEEHFEPGPTAPLPPQEDLHFWGIVVGLVAGPLLLLWLVIVRPDVSGWWTLGALALTVGGFVLLVLRQPSSRDEDDPDNGARV
jgi:hypothetical protein